MRFITEFKLTEREERGAIDHGFYRKHDCIQELGNMLGGWWQNPVNGNNLHHRLDIEAFPMDKWVEFRKRFLAALPDYDNTSRIKLENALHDLESFGTLKETKQ